jgi:intracellular sulfur oxidation DsrE/DsrF family protein
MVAGTLKCNRQLRIGFILFMLKYYAMKRLILIISLVIFAFSFSTAQGKRPYNVVFDITGKDTVEYKAVIRWVNEILKADPSAKLEVVFYGQSLDMAVQGKSLVEESVKMLAENKNVAFRVCAVAMKNHNLDKSQLITGVQTVPDGIYEIISKQGEGWGYIKVAF